MSKQGENGISWTDETWNPIRGCRRVSDGCRNCYAERVAHRFSGEGQPYEGLTDAKGRWNGEVMFLPEKLVEPLRWTKPRLVFVNSMSDLFFEKLSNAQIAAIFAVMAAASRHTFQVLTKRAARMVEWFKWLEQQAQTKTVPGLEDARLAVCLGHLQELAPEVYLRAKKTAEELVWPLPNVWLGVSVEDQAAADARIPLLLQCPAAVRWISAEPLLGAVDLSRWLGEIGELGAWTGFGERLDWVVVGGESGPGARPMQVQWARDLRDQCQAAGVAFHFKQWGAWGPRPGEYGKGTPLLSRLGKKAMGRELDGRTWDEWPKAAAP